VQVIITGLYSYPVKSCAGIPLQHTVLTNKGVAGDREWVVVDASGQFVSQRKYPRLTLLQVSAHPEGFVFNLRDSARSMPPCEVKRPRLSAQPIEVKIWKDHAPALLASDDVNRWLQEALKAQKPLYLACFDKRGARLPGNPERFGADACHFADTAPYLVVNALSLHMLNLSLRLQSLQEVDIRHFRPNIVFSGLPGFAEQYVRTLRHTTTGVTFNFVDACQRCSVITVDPDSGERLESAVPFSQLMAINPMPDNDKAPAFGMNARLVPQENEARVQIGDRFEVEF